MSREKNAGKDFHTLPKVFLSVSLAFDAAETAGILSSACESRIAARAAADESLQYPATGGLTAWYQISYQSADKTETMK